MLSVAIINYVTYVLQDPGLFCSLLSCLWSDGSHLCGSQWHIAPRSRCLSANVNHSMSYLTFPRKGNDTDSIIICARIFRNFPRLRKLDVLWTIKLNIPVSYIMGKKGFAAFIKDFYNDPFKWWVPTHITSKYLAVRNAECASVKCDYYRSNFL